VIVVNTGDDREFYGLHVSPDLDIVTYTLAGRVNTERGYGLEGDDFAVVDALAQLGHETWFRLGDRDFATSLHRTLRLRAGAGLAAAVDDVRRAFGVRPRILPMSEDPCPTIVELDDGRRLHFEEYLARDGAPDQVRAVDLSAARRAGLAPGVGEALRSARVVLICPSNPVVSIGPILAVPGVRQSVAASGAPVVAVSPIVAGAPVKGPADRLLRGIGIEVSARGVASLYRGLAHGFVLDERDTDQEADVLALGMRCAVVDTIMRDRRASTALARAALELADTLA
jgi:LPPG:FO 2-phospho-L-lactate transferase